MTSIKSIDPFAQVASKKIFTKIEELGQKHTRNDEKAGNGNFIDRLAETSLGKKVSSSKKNDKALMQAADQVEAFLINMMFKEIRKSIGKDKLFHGGMSEEIFQDMLYHEYSKIMAENTKFGLAEMIYDQFGGETGRNKQPGTHFSGKY